MPREFSRNQRLGNQIQRALSEFLKSEVKDPRLKDVSLTAVELSRDLGVALIHFSVWTRSGRSHRRQRGCKVPRVSCARGSAVRSRFGMCRNSVSCTTTVQNTQPTSAD